MYALKIKLRSFLLALAAIIISAPFAVIAEMIPVAAASTSYSQMSIEDKIAAYQFYENLFVKNKCSTADTIEGSRINNYDFFNEYGDTYIYVGYVASPNSSALGCGSGNTLKAAASALGLSSSNPGELLCSLGYTQTNAQSSATKTSCSTGSTKIGAGDSFHISNSSSAIAAHLRSTVFGGSAPQWTNAMAYVSTLTDFTTACKAQPADGTYGATVVNIKVVGSDGTIKTQPYSYSKNDGTYFAAAGDIGADGDGSYGGAGADQCDGIASALASANSKYVTAYQQQVYQQACEQKYSSTAEVNGCMAGVAHQTSLTYCTTTYPGKANSASRLACYEGQGNQGEDACVIAYSYTTTDTIKACIAGAQNATDPSYCSTQYAPNAPLVAACSNGQKTPADGGLTIPNSGLVPDKNTDSTSSCSIPEVGWIVCPVTGFLAGIADGAYGFLANNFLQVDTKTVSQSSPTYDAWQAVRNIANIAFVIAFLIIIFSQLSGMGISNYGVKKMLPRLVVAAVLVNLSFYICQIAVDLSNILGYSLKDLFTTAGHNIKSSYNPSDESGNWVGITAAVIGGGAIVWASLGVLIPLLLAAVVALLMTFLILVVRQALIILLIVIAPLAFVAFLLPNTEQWFQKWRKALTSLLLVFPIIGVLFGASTLASSILKAVYAGTSNTLGLIVAAGVMAIPLFLLPALLKGSLNAIGSIGGRLNALSAKGQGLARKGGQKAYDNSRLGQFKKYRSAERDKRRALMQAGTYKGKGGKVNPRNWVSGVNKAINNSAISGKFGDRSAATGVALAHKMEEEEVENAVVRMRSESDPSNLITDSADNLQKAIKSGDVVKARAAQKILLNSGNKGISKLQEALEQSMPTMQDKGSDVGQNLRADLNGAGLKGKNNILASWAYNDKDFGSTVVDAGTYKLNDVEMAGQGIDVLKAAQGAGHISQAQAAAIRDNENVWKDLDPEKKALFNSIAGPRATPQQQSQPQTQPIPTPQTQPATQPIPTPQPQPQSAPQTQPIPSPQPTPQPQPQSGYAPRPNGPNGFLVPPSSPQPTPPPNTPPSGDYAPREGGPNEFLVPRDK